ncbi:Rhodanese-like protein [Auriculariales sp. MPI-PUGE-AT-0066]|nr:Rhodanese-like protein [Auriculariales sp. MPI-PUGE-AT-0066]
MSVLSTATRTIAPLLVEPASIQGKKCIFVNTTWFMPGTQRNPLQEHAQKRLPAARFFDLDAVASEHPLGLKHMLPKPAQFAEARARLGIEPTSHVVLYDTHGVFSAPRALYTFRAFGHTNSSVLNGGLPRWEAEGLPLDTAGAKEPTAVKSEVPAFDESVVKSYEQMVSNSSLDPASDSTAALVLDARSRGRWLGTDPEPRPGLSSGHMSHSRSLPFQSFLDPVPASADGKPGYSVFKSPDGVRAALLGALGGDEALLQQVLEGKRSITNSCGSGMTACILWLGLQLLGVKSAVYDESWTGYAMRAESKIITGNALN